jgi:cytochrome b561
MHRHKSLGLLAGMVVFPRVGYRLMTRAKYDQVPEVVGSGPVESAIAKWMHYALYGKLRNCGLFTSNLIN